jgi:hypothetical protein
MSQDETVVNEEVTTSGTNVPLEVTPVVSEDATRTQPGDKTDSALLLESLKKEREERRILQEKLRLAEEQQLTSSAPSDEFSDEGRALKTEIQKANEEIRKLQDERELEKVYAQFPDLKGLSSEFETYAAEYPRHKKENIAKLFLSEKGLMETPRKGLEKTTGGPKGSFTSGMTVDEVRDLRTTNYKKYVEMLQKGQIEIR